MGLCLGQSGEIVLSYAIMENAINDSPKIQDGECVAPDKGPQQSGPTETGSVCGPSGSAETHPAPDKRVGSLHLDAHFHGALSTETRTAQPPPSGRPAPHAH